MLRSSHRDISEYYVEMEKGQILIILPSRRCGTDQGLQKRAQRRVD